MTSYNSNQTYGELKEHLKEQVEFLHLSNMNFDKGISGEAKRLATTIRVLLHDTKLSKSLLEQLNLKSIKFLSTCKDRDLSNIGYAGLVDMVIGESIMPFIPILDANTCLKFLDFKDWWNEVIFKDQHNLTLTRREVILFAANQDGGAHIDPELKEKEMMFSRKNALGWLTSKDGTIWENFKYPERVAIRQISHEVLKTLIPNYACNHQYVNNGYVISGIKIGFE